MITTSVIGLLIDIFIPSFCGSCRVFLSWPAQSVCNRCSEIIQPIANKDIILSKHYTMPVFALCRYSYPLKDLVLNKHSLSTWGSEALAERMINYIPLDHMQVELCIPIPLHRSRLGYRGFNQARIIAQRIADYKTALLIEPLERHRSTAFQSSVSFDQRAKNVKSAFRMRASFDSNMITNKHILLIDDLMTTGSTLKEVAQLLVDYKPASISAFVACRTP